MKKSHAYILAVATLLIGLFIGGWAVSRFHVRYANLSVAADANLTSATLKALRTGDTANAIELLEIRLDGALASLAPFTGSGAPSETLQIKALTTANAYRAEFPRVSK